MVDEKDLIRKRGSYKGQLTLFTTYLGTLRESSLTQAEASQLQLRIGKIEALYESYDDVQIQLECISEDLDALMAERDEFQNNYFSVLSRAHDMLSHFNKKRDEFESCSNRGSRSGSGNHKLVKLPTIQLPKFQGSYENWLGFRDTFTSLIHSNDDIDNINKFHYLRASLEGSAALVIQSIEYSGSNYELAWKILCERYDNKRLLLHNHVSALFNVEPITKESSMHIKRLVDQVNKNLRCLESLGEPVKHWDTLLIHIISNKLDASTFREWEEHKGSLDKNLPILFDNFITFMRNRADLIETLELSSTSGAGQSSQPAKNASRHRTLLSTHNTKHCVTPSSKPCPKCNGEHTLNNCAQFLALSNSERLNLLPSYKVCFNCFRSGHYANQCKKAGCKLCKRKHNSLIHVAEHNKITGSGSCDRSGAQAGTAPAAVAGSAPVTLSASMSTASQACTPEYRVVLLATALIKVYGHDNREFIVKAVLDNGSAISIMSERLCRQLNLHTDQVNRAIVGINKLKTPVGKICQVPMRSLNDTYSTSLTCSVLPSITDRTPYHQIDAHDISRLGIPSDLCLADPNFHTPSEIDILIGGDLFWDLLGSQRINLGDGRTVLCETKLGYIIAGPIISGQVSDPSHDSHDIQCNFANVIPNTSSEMLNDEIQTQLTRVCQLEKGCPEDYNYSPWGSGPTYLSQDRSQWSVSPVVVEALPKTRSKVALHVNVSNTRSEENGNGVIDFFRFSNLSRLIRTVSYTLRFVGVCGKQVLSTTYLNDSELKTALNMVIRFSQAESFPEYSLLLCSHRLPNKSPLLKLNVFMDENKIMHVGDRLDNSDFSFEKKHPIIIHVKHRFTKLLFESEHKRLMHAGPQLLLSTVKDEYWPIGGTNLAKSCFRKCARMKGQVIAPLMGNLPASRLIPDVPIKSVGFDYAGPLTSASRQGRGCSLVKVRCIAIFVCFTTKAVHLELVDDLASYSHLSALRRFVSCRGLPADIYSDNSTSFVGAYNDLSKFLCSNCSSLAETAANEKINFHFIPVYSPHSGGLWEAGVKSAQFNLKRVLGDCMLAYEDLNTVLAQIEEILNSRPLTPISSDPQHMVPLTPGHFLIGRPLTSLPVKDIRDRNWSKEYVSEALRLDTLLLIKEDKLPHLKWKLGRVVAVHPENDGIARVADIRTAGGLVQRSFSKICPLPVTDEAG